jgi:hypothetical protein
LTDRGLKALKPRDRPYDVMDDDVRAFGVRVLTTGKKSFVLYRRFPGSPSPVRRALGRYGEMSLADARELARDWIAAIKKGIDPSREEKGREQAAIEAERVRKANTVAAALQAYFTHKSDLRTIRAREVEMRRELASWLDQDRALTSISERDVKELIVKIKNRGAKGQARVTLALVKSFFSWCVDSGDYGLEISPAARIKRAALVVP